MSPRTTPAPEIPAFRAVPRTGVIYVTTEAQAAGFDPRDPEWCNLGQGQPETGPLPGAPPRVERIEIQSEDQEYAPVPGIWELREAVADLYNQLYRRGMGSRYSAENVAISGGGRAALTRIAATLGHVNLGHFLPDYTAYEELLDLFRSFTPIPILLDADRGYAFGVDALRSEILGMGLGAILLSNPCNPTGKLVAGAELSGWVESARHLECALLVDEFYSHYVWTGEHEETARPVSAAAYVEDVDRDPVILFDGLTKNWRYPGWRVTWTVGPKQVIEAVSSAGSFLDGGGSRPMQRATLPLLTPEHVDAEHKAIQRAFRKKRTALIDGLEGCGITIDRYPEGTFYVWGNLAGLPHGLDDGMSFFRKALAAKVIVVPGEFFDVNPGRRRPGRASRFRSHIRFSFGPPLAVVEQGVARLREMIEARC
ncbi:MAG: pyridoxal phosphate-dependent aminotransferase [Deltaproteobacteria bacterium]|nr:MAG: pyridoxal phosphate-dependent aminotransferase [Deltaproteobacteria bacterium]